jgi:RNA polymerase sigma factor (sigma-70 family)
MAETPSEFAALMERVRAGCPQAAQEVFNLYSDAVRQIVRRHLGPRLRTHADSQDFLQMVWTSFFKDAADRYNFPDPDSLVNFLSRLARNEMSTAFRDNFARDKRNRDRTHSLEELPEQQPEELAVRQPTPSQLVIAEEQWERLLEGLPPNARRILEMLRQGYSHTEIATELNCSRMLIHRLIQKLHKRMGLP